jgi:hypothetical protein
MAYKVPNPERERTERNRELKRLRTKTAPGRERAERAAELVVAFHEERDINSVMELAQLVVDDVDDGIAVLLNAYVGEVPGTEDRMERLAMLCNVARWADLPDLEAAAREQGVEAAASWAGSVTDEMEQADRLTLIERRFDADLRRAVQERL